MRTLFILLWIISWWNVENLFDTHHDSLKNDIEYTREGARHWTYTRYQHKVDNISRVVCNMGGWNHPVLVGLAEVENDYCLTSLCYTMRAFAYRPIHFESQDERGIDVALLYDSTRFTPLAAEPLAIDLGQDHTRDILFVTGCLTATDDTLYCFCCHLPSMRDGAAASEWKRNRAKAIIQQRVDSIFARSPQALILVMGDMNTAPKNDLHGLDNSMLPLARHGEGTHYYHGRWACLDQCYLSPALAARAQVTIYRPAWMLVPAPDGLDSIPRRTFRGYRYDPGGYSDHLPLCITF